MRRYSTLSLIMGGALTCLLLLMSALSLPTVAAGDPETPAVSVSANPEVALQIEVNYAHEWIAGATDPFAGVAITLTDDQGAVKSVATVDADDTGNFFTDCPDWTDGHCPDIASGDRVTATTPGATTAVNPVGALTAALDEVENTAAGTLDAPWFTEPLSITCMVWVEMGPPPVETSADPDGGSFLCDFDDVGWDLALGDTVALRYQEPDGDGVINVLEFPWTRVNIGHDWVGANYPAGHTFQITVTDSADTVKATAQAESATGQGWGGDGFDTQDWQWAPEQPDIVPGDHVHVASDDGYLNTIDVGVITGNLDVSGDAVTGTVSAPWFIDPLDVECHPWGAWDYGEEADVKSSTAAPDGSSPYGCSWAGEWDLVPGRDIAVMYIEPDRDRVIDVFREQAPYLRINKWARGEGGEGGNLLFTVEYWNDGDAAAESVVITDTLEGMTYLMDTSPFPVMTGTLPGGEVVILDLGTVEAYSYGTFGVFAAISGAPPDPLTNTAQIATTNPFDQGDPEEKISTWTGQVQPNDTHLDVGKGAWTDDPAADTDVVFHVNVCNNGGTGSSRVVLTDTLHADLALVTWWAQQPGWYAWYTSTHELVLSTASIAGGSCSEVYVQAHVLAELEPGAYLSNTAVIAAANDLETHDNETTWEGQVHDPRINLSIRKWWNRGQLVPGGELYYGIGYDNSGNVPIEGPIYITDTLPAGTSFVAAWWHDESGQHPFDPVYVGAETVVWEIASLDNGYGFDFEVVLAVDGDAAPGTILTNTASISPQPEELDLTDNEASWTEVLNEPGPNLRVQKSHGWNGDEQLGYEIYFENVGDTTVSDVWVTDTLPADTAWDGGWDMGFDWDRLVETVESPGLLAWRFSEIYPGDIGWVRFNANLDFPGEPLRWYTNTVEMTSPPGDVNLADNADVDIAFSGGEVHWVELYVETDNSTIWGEAVAGSPVTVTVPAGQFYAFAEPECGGCWNIDDIGPVFAADTVIVEAADAAQPVTIVVPDPFTAEADSATGTVWGQIDHLDMEWVTVDLHGGPHMQVQTDGDGYYSAVFPDFPRRGSGEVRYETEVDYARVEYHREFESPDLVMRVNYGHDWVEGNYEAGHTVWITATESDMETIKATAVLTTGEVPWWGGDTGFSTNWQGWIPEQPDLLPGDWIFAQASNSYSSTVRIGTIVGALDVDADTVSGTVSAPWFAEPLAANCGVWEENGPGFDFMIDPDGGSYYCDFSTEGWDLMPGHLVGVEYQEPDQDWVVNMFQEPAPNVQISKWAEGEGGEGGNLRFTIDYRNGGGAAAEGVVITDTLLGMTYLMDTSPFPVITGTIPGGEYIVLDLGTVEAESGGSFALFAAVTGAPPDPLTNTAQIATSNPFDQGDPEEKISTWSSQVQSNDTHLNIDKWSWTGDPAADTDIVFTVNACNNGGTGSSDVVLTDTLHADLTLVTWWAQQPGWYELAGSAHELVLATPSVAGWSCSEVYLQAHVAAELEPGAYLSNTAIIAAANDLETEDNAVFWEGEVNEPHTNLIIAKWWNWGQLVPGGELHYNINYWNDGNVPVAGPILITDTLPAGTSFVAAWWHDESGQHSFDPVSVGAEEVVWEIGGLDNGYGFNFEVVLAVASDVAPGTVLTNTAAISPQPGEDSYDDNEATWVETVYAHGPNLRVRKGGHWDDWGEDTRQAAYWLSVENIGDESVGPVTLIDTYPEGMVVSEGPDTEWWRLEEWADDPASHTLTATFSYLDPGESTSFGFAAVVPGEGPLPFGMIYTNTAAVGAAPGEAYLDDNEAQRILTTGPDLTLVKGLAAGDLLPGAQITFSLVFTNDRPGHEWWWNMQGTAWLTDTLPPELTYVGAELRYCDEFGDPCPFEPAVNDGTTLAWELWALNTSEWNEILLTVQITDTVDGDDVFGNWAEIGSSMPVTDAEPYYANNVNTVGMAIALPLFEVAKAHESNQVAGMAVTYTLAVTNTGHVAGTNLLLRDALPAGLTYEDGDGSFDGADITWSIADLAAGAWASGWFRATLPCQIGAAVDNDDYGVSASDQGVTAIGDPISFNVIAPTIDLTVDQSAGAIVVGNTVYFTATASTDGTPLSYEWDFGGGSTATGLAASHTYTTDGSFAVTFTTVDSCGHSATELAAVTVNPPALVAVIAQSDLEIVVGESVSFTDQSTTDGPAIVSWAWDFGDGSPVSTAQNPTHDYMTDGIFVVTLTVTDALGYSDSETGAVTVSPPALAAAFGQSDLEIFAGESVSFTDQSTTDGPAIVSWTWDFGDGSPISTVQHPSHTYAAAGTFTITLTVTDALGYSAVTTGVVVVNTPGIFLPAIVRMP